MATAPMRRWTFSRRPAPTHLWWSSSTAGTGAVWTSPTTPLSPLRCVTWGPAWWWSITPCARARPSNPSRFPISPCRRPVPRPGSGGTLPSMAVTAATSPPSDIRRAVTWPPCCSLATGKNWGAICPQAWCARACPSRACLIWSLCARPHLCKRICASHPPMSAWPARPNGNVPARASCSLWSGAMRAPSFCDTTA